MGEDALPTSAVAMLLMGMDLDDETVQSLRALGYLRLKWLVNDSP
jgi:hypothetical protein